MSQFAFYLFLADVLMYLGCMVTRIRHSIVTIIALIFLTISGVVSASMMVPDQTDIAEARVLMMGLSISDICGDAESHEHRCPFCHIVTTEKMPRTAQTKHQCLQSLAWKQSAHLHRAAQQRDYSRVSRAPPSIS